MESGWEGRGTRSPSVTVAFGISFRNVVAGAVAHSVRAYKGTAVVGWLPASSLVGMYDPTFRREEDAPSSTHIRTYTRIQFNYASHTQRARAF